MNITTVQKFWSNESNNYSSPVIACFVEYVTREPDSLLSYIDSRVYMVCYAWFSLEFLKIMVALIWACFIITSCSADLNTGVIFVVFSFTGNTPNLIAVSTICNSGTFISSYTDIIAFTCISSDPVSWHFKESQAPLNSYFLSIFSSRKASDLVK